jgi:hypothetical protein
MVGGQLQQLRRTRQPLAPVRQLPIQHLAFQLLALPHRVVGVLHRQLGERRLTPRQVRRVQRRQLAEEHPHAPPVADDVVHREEQHVLLGAQPQQRRAEERSRGEVERPPRLLADAPPERRLAIRAAERRQVLHRQGKGAEGRDHLHRRAVHLGEDRPQRLVTPDDLAQAPLQRRLVQRTLQAPCPGDVVDGASRLQPVDEPEPLLRERQRQPALPSGGLDRRELRPVPHQVAGPRHLPELQALGRCQFGECRHGVHDLGTPLNRVCGTRAAAIAPGEAAGRGKTSMPRRGRPGAPTNRPLARTAGEPPRRVRSARGT